MFGEAAVRKTFTDYLDDVSNVYADKLILQNEAGPLVVNLSDRSLELGGQPIGSTNKFRGDPTRKDNYFSSELDFHLQLINTNALFYLRKIISIQFVIYTL